ncbi:Squalene/phytoene synthase [Halorubrum californiense DSM 19288]|uniref:Squalene/phytoene synthase n=1 Tax=Halorubrum californiense DSM 19288 TaxID=1227465 RepID=M0EGH6_9EURY|nr:MULTISPECIES: phytoene/squalene synthase family protein [Halorubrum]ELZ46891.1 Squalene/phytoene synthase [Halorubrum californiense DSM 19288]TKX67596.1 phytoene/squalene synthase family protein [Halorubrum sp. GN11GM_10-3_MGM]
MVEQNQVARSKRIQRRTGKTFHVATRLLPQRIRHPTYVLYGFFRIADEVVDAEDTAPPAEQRAELDRLRAAALGEEPTDDPVLEAFAEVVERNGIPDEDVHSFVDAMASDIDTDRYETYTDLEAYMDGSAAAVGRMMTAIMDLDEETEARALPHATKLGEAFQMTNFLRDVREDVVERDRIYLPLETLRRHGVSEGQILDLEFDDSVAAAIREEMARTERLYEEGVAGIKYLPDDCQLAVLLAAVLYVDHHRLIRNRGYDTVSTTPELSLTRKLSLLVRTRWKWQWNRDPEAVFYDMCTDFDPSRERHGHGPHGTGVPQTD